VPALNEIKRGRRLPFVVVPWWLLDCKDIDGYDLAVYCAIARHADNQGEAYPSRTRIAELAGVNIKTVDRAVKTLENAGAIEKRTRRDKAGDPTSNVYIVHELPTGVATQTVPPSDSNGATVATQTVPPVATQTVHELEALELEPTNYKTDKGEDLWKTDGLEYARQQLQRSSAS
jgi:DNA-binding transcriptional MocR family regulator